MHDETSEQPHRETIMNILAYMTPRDLLDIPGLYDLLARELLDENGIPRDDDDE